MASERRAGIGLLQGVALYSGALLGAGVLTFPALAARQAGPASLLAWAGLVLLSVPLASTFAALAGRYPDAGGVATFASRAFGPRWEAVTGWWFYFTVPVGIPVLGLFGGAYVAAATGGGRTTRLAVAVALVAVAVAANWVGLRLSGRLQLVLAALLAALLVVAIAASAPHARSANLYPFAPHGWLAVGGAAVLLVWSFAGWETVTHLAAEFADPARDLRRATAAALILIGALYLGLAAVSVLVLGPGLEQVDAPLAVLLAHGVGGSVSAGTVAAVVAVVVTLGAMNAYVASAARLGVALGRDGALPGWLAGGGQASEVTRRSLATVAALTGVVLVGLLVTGADGHVLLLATTSSLAAIYTVGSAAGTRLLPRGSPGHRAAVTSTVLVAGLLLLAGPFLAWPVALAAGALTTRRVLGRRRAPGGGPFPPTASETRRTTVIARIWRGWTTPENADAYQRIVSEEVLPGIAGRNLDGYHGAYLLRRDLGGEVEFATITLFDTLDDVRAFAGDDYEAAYVPPRARAVLARFDERSAHYETLLQPRS